MEHDAFSDVNSEYMRLPLPEGIDECVESPAYEPSIGLEDTLTPPIDTFSNSDVDNLRRIIGDACAATNSVEDLAFSELGLKHMKSHGKTKTQKIQRCIALKCRNIIPSTTEGGMTC